MVAIYLCEVDREKILDMPYPFFTEVLAQLNRVLRFDAAVAYAGNAFVEESGKAIEEAHPFYSDKKEEEESYANHIKNLLAASAMKLELKQRNKGAGISEA